MSTKTEKIFSKINLLAYLIGASNLWVKDIDLPKLFIRIHTPLVKLNSVMTFLSILMHISSFLTQSNLTSKQEGDTFVLGWSLLLLYFYLIILDKNRKKVRYLMRTLGVDLKLIYNDEEVEREMVRKVKVYGSSIVIMCTMAVIWFGVDAIIQHFLTGAPFAPIIWAWPDVTDQRTSASVGRVISYCYLWIAMFRVYAAFLIVILLAVSLGMQYRNLCSYFYSLNTIFEDNKLTQAEKETKYEGGVRTGIKMHVQTMRCVPVLQEACGAVFTGQMLMNTLMLAAILLKMMRVERTAINFILTIWTAAGFLVSTAVFMWSAGDITAEAINLDQAMYSSGWENCFGMTGVRVRKLLLLAMTMAQRRVAIRSLSIIEVSYQSYVMIVRSSYSVFSVFY